MQQGDALGSALFYLPLRPVRTEVREEYESHGAKGYTYLDAITIEADKTSPGTARVRPFLGRELTARGIHLNRGKG